MVYHELVAALLTQLHCLPISRVGGYSIDEIDYDRQSSLLISGHSDSRDIEDGAHAGDKDCLLARYVLLSVAWLIMEMAQAMRL